jgi:RNA polymerase sigma-70 factor (ECF subfamily)
MEEEYLIAGFKEKDKVVFDFIFNYYYSGLCAFANRYVKDRDVAEDLVQDFFVRLWLDSDGLEVNSSLKSYLFQGVKIVRLII